MNKAQRAGLVVGVVVAVISLGNGLSLYGAAINAVVWGLVAWGVVWALGWRARRSRPESTSNKA